MGERWQRFSAEVGRFLAVGLLATIVALVLFNFLVHGFGAFDAAPLNQHAELAYLTDFADTPENRATAIALAREADILFIEAPFAAADAALAADRRHLTTRAAGEIARAAGARRIEPFHFSPRYLGQEARMLAEVAAAAGRDTL